ncbi:hypothetical protein Tco_0065709 [Tanacetum coccineum]
MIIHPTTRTHSQASRRAPHKKSVTDTLTVHAGDPCGSSEWELIQGCRLKIGNQHAQPEDIQDLLHKLLEDLKIISEELAEFNNSLSWNHPTFYDVDYDEYTIIYRSSKAITPDLSTKEPDNSLSMGDESILALFRKQNRMKSEISPDSNEDYTSSDDDYGEDIEYVEVSPPDSELVSLEEVNDVDQEKEEIDLKDILRIQDVILREKLLNINRLIVNIESLNDYPTPDRLVKSPSSFPIPIADSDSFFEEFDTSLSYSVNSLPEFETFSDHKEETNSGSTTTHADNSLPEYDSFHFEIEPDQGELTNVVMEDILGEPCVHMPNVLPTHPTLMMDSDFIPSDDFLGSNLDVSFPSGNRNKIFDPGIFFEVQSKRFLLRDTFLSLTFKDRHYLSFTYVIRTFLPYFTYLMDSPLLLSSGSEDTIFDLGIST